VRIRETVVRKLKASVSLKLPSLTGFKRGPFLKLKALIKTASIYSNFTKVRLF
jgi:hypothetical protein